MYATKISNVTGDEEYDPRFYEDEDDSLAGFRQQYKG